MFPRTALALAVLGSLATFGCDVPIPWVLPSAAPAPEPSKPIPREAPLGAARVDEMAARMAWGRKHMLESYNRIGIRNAEWDEDARRLIVDSIPTIVGGDKFVPASQRIQTGRALVSRRCKDPLVLYLLGRALFEGTWDSAEPEYFYAQAVEGMKQVPYPRAIARFTASALYGRYEWRAAEVPGQLRPLELQWFEESLTDGSYEPGDSLVLMYQLEHGTGPDFLMRSAAGSAAALDRVPWIEPWVRLLLSGILHQIEAWDARGVGWAKDVSQEAWAQFNTLSARSRRDLVESWRLRPDRPEAASHMIRVAEDDPVPGEGPRLWFDRTVTAQLDAYDAYAGMVTMLLPRWGGSYRGMLSFGGEALGTRRFDTDVPLNAMGAVTAIYDDQRDDRGGGAGGTPIYEWPETYSLLTAVFEGYLREPKQADSKARWHSLWTIAAEHAQRPQEALAHLEAAGFKLTGEAGSHLKGESPPEFIARVALEGGPGAADARRGDALRLRFDNGPALEAYRTALSKDPSPHARPALHRWIAALEMEQRLNKGEWVPLGDASRTLDGWRPRLGTWRVEEDGTIVCTAGARGLLLVSDFRVGPDFEMRARVEIASSSNGFFDAGFVFGHPSWEKRNLFYSFRARRSEDEGSVAYFAEGFSGLAKGVAPPLPVLGSNDLLIRVQAGRMRGFLNGKEIPQYFAPLRGWDKDDRSVVVGFGGYPDNSLLSVRFKNVEIRRLGPK